MSIRIWIVVYVSVFFVFLAHCSIPLDIPRKCNFNGDCQQGHICEQKVCQKGSGQNKAPIAQIKGQGVTQHGKRNVAFPLDGSKSHDPEGDKLAFTWSFAQKPEGSQSRLIYPDASKASFTPDVKGVFVLQLVVQDTQKLNSEPALLRVEILKNTPPVAEAGAEQYVGLSHAVQLDGSLSKDADGDKLTYRWGFLKRPEGSKATLSNTLEVKSTFKPDLVGVYTVQLIVSDGTDASSPDTVKIHVGPGEKPEIKLSQISPVEGTEGQEVQVKLSGSGFEPKSQVLFDGLALSKKNVRYIHSGMLEARFFLLGKTAKSYPIRVRNPDKKESQAVFFKVKKNPCATPKISELIPGYVIQGKKVKVTIVGSCFTPQSSPLFQAVPMQYTYIDSTRLRMDLDLSNTLVGSYMIAVKSPGNRFSNPIKLQVINPPRPPKLRVINPPTGKTGTKVTFGAHGTGFLPGAVILFDGKPIPSKRVRMDEIRADPSLDLTKVKPGTYNVQVKGNYGTLSNVMTFIVEGANPAPVISRILPFTIYLKSKNSVAIYGSHFARGAELLIGSHVFKSPIINIRSTGYIQATIDTTVGTWTKGTVQARIRNPGGRLSNTFSLTVTSKYP